MLIFDEVMTGFRVALGGAQAYYRVKPDLTSLGKVIGGGLPVAAFGGRNEIMSQIAPLGPIYQAGTLSGNPLSMASGLAMLSILEADDSFYQNLSNSTEYLVNGIVAAASMSNVSMTANNVSGMFGLFFRGYTIHIACHWLNNNTSNLLTHLGKQRFDRIQIVVFKG